MDYKNVTLFEAYDNKFLRNIWDDTINEQIESIGEHEKNNKNEINPELFFFFSQSIENNTIEIIQQQLSEFVTLSIYISKQYFPEFHESNLHLKLINFLDCPNKSISSCAAQSLCNLLSNPKIDKYANDLLGVGLLQKIDFHFEKQNYDELIYYYIIMVLNIAAISPYQCFQIFDVIPLKRFQFLAQSNLIDEGSHNMVLRLIMVFSYQIHKYPGESNLTTELIELIHSIFSDFIESRKKRKRILQISSILSCCPDFFTIIPNDSSFSQILSILNENNEELLPFVLYILTNLVKYTNNNILQCIPRIIELFDCPYDSVIKGICNFLYAHLNKYSHEYPEDTRKQICEIILNSFNSHNLGNKILFAQLFIILLNSLQQQTLLEINLDRIFSLLVSIIEINDYPTIYNTLALIDSMFQKLLNIREFSDIKEIFVKEGGLDALNEIQNDSTLSNCSDISNAISLFVNQYFCDFQ
ncbi:hypothetical protein TRFO_23376 [Tritrichomonas foetus]|uniref:Uncharacterized protein n=1 Tax=Tritrichomonas foetus TaxID=1144522 RepID=A0A1J4KAC5_9EUKA|nr:hypothetical protein TRFO_23376 [Tritrichomonas foetus]|eukprot:OHT08171.1 hypothetical protein TRFO_23376 [Tritrichomonas foetus]